MEQNKFKTSIYRFRIISISEGISYLLLLGIAMPLKYMAGIPVAVKITGWIHGLLFILYIISLIQVKYTHHWSLKKTLVAFSASLIPFGPFVLDARVLKKEQHL